MRPQLVQRVVEQRQEVEKQALLHLARIQQRLDEVQHKIDALQPGQVSLKQSINEMLVSELAEERRRQQQQKLLVLQARVREDLRKAQDQLRDARADRCAASSIQDKQKNIIKRQLRRRQQRQLDDMAGAGHLALIRGSG